MLFLCLAVLFAPIKHMCLFPLSSPFDAFLTFWLSCCTRVRPNYNWTGIICMGPHSLATALPYKEFYPMNPKNKAKYSSIVSLRMPFFSLCGQCLSDSQGLVHGHRHSEDFSDLPPSLVSSAKTLTEGISVGPLGRQEGMPERTVR